MRIKSFFLFIVATAMPFATSAQNYDEAAIAPYTLPDMMVTETGKNVTSAAEWEGRRAELINLFSEHMYGFLPANEVKARYKTIEQSADALGGKAIRKQVVATFTVNGKSASMNILIYLPKEAKKPVPLFFGLNFYGNHAINADPAILKTDAFALNVDEKGIFNNKSSEAIRGIQSARWCAERVIDEGYGLATVYYGEIYPDHEQGRDEGLAALLDKKADAARWEAIGAWAWGISRAMDHLVTDKAIDSEKVILLGHSRLGKAALWAGARDARFAAVISNNSGCGGSALFRRKIGETARIINNSFPHWFCENFKRYSDKEELLPVDQHELIALIAPRPVYISSAEDDLWADPKGEYLSAFYAGKAYELYGLKGLESEAVPPVNTPVGDYVGYHIRTGGHNVTPYDWECFLAFANVFVKREQR